jgi:hypothetical protein
MSEAIPQSHIYVFFLMFWTLCIASTVTVSVGREMQVLLGWTLRQFYIHVPPSISMLCTASSLPLSVHHSFSIQPVAREQHFARDPVVCCPRRQLE